MKEKLKTQELRVKKKQMKKQLEEIQEKVEEDEESKRESLEVKEKPENPFVSYKLIGSTQAEITQNIAEQQKQQLKFVLDEDQQFEQIASLLSISNNKNQQAKIFQPEKSITMEKIIRKKELNVY